MDFQNEDSLSLVNKDVMSKIVSYLPPIDKHIIGLVHRDFKKDSMFDSRLLTTRNALELNRLHYIKLSEEMKGKNINVNRHFANIIKTDNIEIISYLIDPHLFQKQINDHVFTILPVCSPNTISYLFPNFHLCHNHIQVILIHNRIDVIEYYRTYKQIDIFCGLSKEDMTVKYIFNLEFLKVYYKNRQQISTVHVRDSVLSNNLDHVKWIFENFHSFVDDFFKKYKFPKVFKLNKDIVAWLYNKGYNIYDDMYAFALCGDLLKDINIEPLHLNNPINEYALTFNASNGKFDIENILSCSLTQLSAYKIIYYSIKYKVKDIYENEKFVTLEEREDYITISSLNVDTCLLDYMLLCEQVRKYEQFVYKYIDIIVSQNNKKVMDLLHKKYGYRLSVVIDLHRKGMTEVMNELPSFMFNANIDIDKHHLIYICNLPDSCLIKNDIINSLIDSPIYIRLIFKHCDVPTFIKYINNTNHNIQDHNNNNNKILVYGNLDIIKYYSKHGVINKYSLIRAFQNCPGAANILIKSKHYRNHNLSSFILSSTEIHLPSSDILSKYYIWLLTTNPSITNISIKKIIKSNKDIFYKYILNKSLTPHVFLAKTHINTMIKYNSYEILEHVASIGQFILPFCCYSPNKPINQSLEEFIATITKLQCSCKNSLLCSDNHLNIVKVAKIHKIYSYHFKKLEENFTNNLISTHPDIHNPHSPQNNCHIEPPSKNKQLLKSKIDMNFITPINKVNRNLNTGMNINADTLDNANRHIMTSKYYKNNVVHIDEAYNFVFNYKK